jgi:hypothetical protein
MEEQRSNSVNVSSLSAGEYTTTWLMIVTWSSPAAVSKQDFKAWKQKYSFSLAWIFSAIL